jgi:undecaprenyl-diphosphatase
MLDFYTNIIKALILGIVEGLTEFLPISSTGHQILVADLLNFTGDKAIFFNIIIQFAAILAVIVHFRVKIIEILTGLLKLEQASLNFAINIVLAFLPAAILGVLFIDIIKKVFFNPITVAIMLIVGGILMLWTERLKPANNIHQIEEVPYIKALLIGCFQSLALVPGVSRSAATIIGARLFGLTRQTATDFSFFLAIPTMLGAFVYSLYKSYNSFNDADLWVLITGFVASFVVALLTVKILLNFIASHKYDIFAYYRLIIGFFILVTWYFDIINWSFLGA